MSHENVTLTRRTYDAFSSRDIDAFLEILDEDVEFVAYVQAAVEGAGYKGHDGMRRMWENMLDVWPDLTAEILEVHALGEFTYGAIRFHVHGAGSDVPLNWTLWQIGRWRGAKLVWLHTADTRAAVLEAAGLVRTQPLAVGPLVLSPANSCGTVDTCFKRFRAVGSGSLSAC
jgi:ketosteroid isomerase-like protein